MEFKGIKGKWWACCTSEESKSHFVFDSGEAVICAMRSNDPDDEESDYESMEGIVTVSERQANAKLIAAAPELLDALQRTLKALEIANGRIEDFGGVAIGDKGSIPQAKKAINKALNGE